MNTPDTRDALAALILRAEKKVEDRRLTPANHARYVRLWRWLVCRLARAILLDAESEGGAQ